MKADKLDREREIAINISGKKLIAFLIIITLWALSLWGMWIYANKKLVNNEASQAEKLYPFINPRLRSLAQEERTSSAFVTLIPLRDKLFDFLADKKDNTAFYVEDLNTGAWVGWQEKENFIGASLLKISIAIGVMKKIDDGDWTLDTTFPIKAEYKNKGFGNLWQVNDGALLSVRKLLDEMLKNSDNTASITLYSNMTPEERDNVYYHIGLTNPEMENLNNQSFDIYKITPRNLATMFRALYDATYLTRASSNYILETLTQTGFDKLIPKNIPSEIKVSHKIAAFSDETLQQYRNYHDCGIAFVPNHPYLYCLITQDLDSDTAQDIIVGMGDRIFSYFSNEKDKR